MAKDPDILVDLTTARTAFEAEMIAESLRAQGIAAEAFTTVGSMLQWDIAATQPMRVQVRRRDLDRAREVLARTREDAKGIDWSKAPAEVLLERAEGGVEKCLGCGYDVSTLPDAEVCPECGTSLVPDNERRRSDDGVKWVCLRCGYDVTGLGFDRKCPECGASISDPSRVHEPPPRWLPWLCIGAALISLIVVSRVLFGVGWP